MKKLVSFFLILTLLFMAIPAFAANQEQISSSQSEIQSLIKEISDLDSQANDLESQINKLNEEIEAASNNLIAAQEEVIELEELSGERIKAAYMFGTEGYFDYLMTADNPSDFISYYDIAKDILSADKETLTELQNKKKEIETLRQELVQNRDKLVQTRDQAESVRGTKQQTLEANQQLLTTLSNQLTTQSTSAVDTSKEVPTANISSAQLESLTTQTSTPSVLNNNLTYSADGSSASSQNLDTDQNNQEENAETDDASAAYISPRWKGTNSFNYEGYTDSDGNPYIVSVPNTTGSLIGIAKAEFPSTLYWPLDASKENSFVITSKIGKRESPGGIGSTDHGGVDIGADYGTMIVAASSGTVEIANVFGGYGNCVMINHGNGFRTLYGHMSSIAVSNGQYVQAGQVIGLVGSTGWSTGPHLHYEVRYTDSSGNETKLNGLSLYGDEILNRLRYTS